ncbi:ProQ/FINO family protein [Azospirillum agricola]|uniref:ProQ/FINO family protein n=1 Tax=Azospirillum agricola TaxID=1720247 RepID=UPI000A0F1599|nr:ProQ/FinO family protein [Azospirillum agricola]SMH29490.1 ProQ/FINO family protein [Azospirillum lipoferum]
MKMLTAPPLADDALSTPVTGSLEQGAGSLTARMCALWNHCTPDRQRTLFEACEWMIAEGETIGSLLAGSSARNPTGLHADRRALARAFPACFNRPKSKAPKRPLKVGIVADAVARGVTGEDGRPLTAKRIERAVADYCTGTKYEAALIAGAVRIDLDGDPAGTVLPAHAAHAPGRAKTDAPEAAA